MPTSIEIMADPNLRRFSIALLQIAQSGRITKEDLMQIEEAHREGTIPAAISKMYKALADGK